MTWLTRNAIEEMGFSKVGYQVMISDRASFYNCGNIELGSNIRIDDFCVLSAGKGGISIGNFVHIAVFSSLIGGGRIVINDFANISARVSIYSSNDDYSGESMTNPTIPDKFKNVQVDNVEIGRHVIVGAGSVILPGVELNKGAAIGALSLVRTSCRPFEIYAGNPLKYIGKRSEKLLELERGFLQDN